MKGGTTCWVHPWVEGLRYEWFMGICECDGRLYTSEPRLECPWIAMAAAAGKALAAMRSER